MWVRDIFKQREEKGAYHTLVQVTTWISIFKICTTFVVEKVLRLPFFFFLQNFLYKFYINLCFKIIFYFF